MLKIHIANSSIGEITWEPPLSAQELLLNLTDEDRAIVISDLEQLMEASCNTLLSGLLAGPAVGSLLLYNFSSILLEHNQQAIELLAYYSGSTHP